jgi:DNA-binding response OmpR family regulator
MNVLVVDDDPIVLASCLRVLRAEGFAVFTASSVVEALPAASQREYDLFLVDVKMPERDGIQLMSDLRRKGVKAPVIVMSGYPTPETIAAGREGGAIAFLPKPFTPAELLQAVRGALGPQRGGR